MIFCTKCGKQYDETTGFCPACGTPAQQQAQQPQQPQYQAQPQYQQQPQYQAQPQYQQQQFQQANNNVNNININLNGGSKTSTWDGGVLETIGNSIVASLIISFSCGIATPWAVCYMMKFIIGHTIIDGKRLRFEGNGGSLFGQWLLWSILTVITCGIYGFWVTPKMYKWIASNIHAEN